MQGGLGCQGQCMKSPVPHHPRPAISNQGSGDAGDQRQRDEGLWVEVERDQQAANEEGQFSRCEGQWHAGILSKGHAGRKRQRDRSVEALEKAHGCIVWACRLGR
jgi:hypothetical protein